MLTNVKGKREEACVDVVKLQVKKRIYPLPTKAIHYHSSNGH